ncbi:hypothetical protein MA16_Dca021009 [Dendrobium catenatum]|uniref:Uncharacterized protein n=1 Tax=Dendrobium catenatum TaxID=906689 RepID=A0A2I0VZJ3_9ASPA|nr:hypothetical protein MA16_Dca021009 [Dendrobium catenatum]
MKQVANPPTVSKSVEELQIHIIFLYPFYLRSLSPPYAKPSQRDIEFMSFRSQ